ncbi:hypothetical protein [Paraburkholderia sp. MM5477-R1]|uniref:hypothetical protein n=1 Tax=Paraburkholderia sp. MM5477-R1 TaxID=2991062 RepID=UPI003D1AC192
MNWTKKTPLFHELDNVRTWESEKDLEKKPLRIIPASPAKLLYEFKERRTYETHVYIPNGCSRNVGVRYRARELFL